MGDFFQPLDLVIFFAFLIFAMAVGLIAGRKEETSEDFFLAGRKIPWWGVAGSIFGSNVSANHMVGMMGIGFSIGFAQSHFELGAIYLQLPVFFGEFVLFVAQRIGNLSFRFIILFLFLQFLIFFLGNAAGKSSHGNE